MNESINKLYNAFVQRRSLHPSQKTPLSRAAMTNIRNDIINLSVEIKNVYSHYSDELFALKDTLYILQVNQYNQQGHFFAPETFSEIFSILKALKYDIDNGYALGFWAYIHPKVIDVSKQLFINDHYFNAVQNAFVEINDRIKKIRKKIDGNELDGADLMRKTFGTEQPKLLFEDNSTDSGKNIQQGFMNIFAGAIQGIRNPNAHENMEIGKNDAIRQLMLASLLMHKVDDAVRFSSIEG